MPDQDPETQAAVPPVPEKKEPSEARLRANRLNAQNSKGPPASRARSGLV